MDPSEKRLSTTLEENSDCPDHRERIHAHHPSFDDGPSKRTCVYTVDEKDVSQ